METLMQVKYSLEHNAPHIFETLTVWMILLFGKVAGDVIEQPVILQVLPYFQLIALILASGASLFTMYKIRKDLIKK